MHSEKNDAERRQNPPPEIDHGPNIDHVEPRAPIPCSKTLQQGTQRGWCLRPQGHKDECEGRLSEPYDTTKPITIVVHTPKPKQ